jgi:AcrR family transcriptional regulator
MGRPATQHEARKAAIVSAALTCFAEHGYEGTSNKLIAQTAGLNSAALIYHYFPSKEDLFKACLYSFSIMDNLKDILENAYDKPPEEFLHYVGVFYQQLLRTTPISKLVPMFMGTIQSHPELVPMFVERLESVIWLPISRYLQKKMDEGVMRPMSQAGMLQIFLGPLVIRIMSHIFMEASVVSDTDSDDTFVQNLVKTFLDGVMIR